MIEDIHLHCPKCRYNLTGLVLNVCPECGFEFDLEWLRTDREMRRIGTPAYCSRGWRLIFGVPQTVLLMLVRPRAFAQRMRIDEPLAPALAMLGMGVFPSLWIMVGYPGFSWWALSHCWVEIVVVVSVIVMLVLLSALIFAALSSHDRPLRWSFRYRFRFWCTVLMYTMIFAPFWPFFCARTWPLEWRQYNITWPFFYLYYGNEAYLATILLLWWTVILGVVVWYRNRPRLLAIASMPLAFLFVRAVIQLVDLAIPRLSR